MFVIPFLIITALNIKEMGDAGVQINFSGREIEINNLKFPQAASFARAGEPDVPSLNLFIGVPQEGGVDVRIVEHQTETFYGIDIRPVMPLAIYEGESDKNAGQISEVYQRDNLYPENIVEISDPNYLRDINTINLRINPVRYNPVKKELVVSRVLKIMVNFKGKPRVVPIFDDSFEEIYKRLIINYDQCKDWRRERILQSIKNPFSTGVWFKIEVDNEGMYKIGYDELKKAGIDPRQFDPKTMKIYNAAFELLPRNVLQQFPDSLIEIPVYVEGEEDHRFDKQDYLVFYGFPASHFVPDTIINWYENGYARNNVYWFTFGGSYGKRMEKVNASSNNSNPDTIVKEIIHLEEDVHNPTRSGINWYWMDFSLSKSAESTMIRMPIRHKFAKGRAEIIVSIFDSMSPTSVPFWYRLSLSEETFYNDTVILPQSMSLPPVKIKGEVSITGDSSFFEYKARRFPPDTTQLTVYLNCFDIKYDRLTDMSYPFHCYFKTSGDYTIKCSNVTSTPFIIDITDLHQPKMFENFTISGKEIVFSSRCDSFQLLYASQLKSAVAAKLIPANPGRLRTIDNGCEYLIITHRNFYSSIMPLVNYRKQEYTTKVVTVDQIFDDFSYGKYDPLAIKHFLYHTYNHWTTVPKYVFIVGDATYDYKNNLQKENPPNYVPMYETGTTLSGNPGIPPNYIYEGEYVNFFGTEAMVMGRITVRNNQEVRDFIDKVFAYEKSDIDGTWNKRIILAADDEYAKGWEGILHTSACEAVSYVVADSLYDRAKVYMLSYLPFPPHDDNTVKPLATEDFIKELNKGALIGCFFGHGNTHQLAHEKLFYETDISKVSNGRRFFFFYFASCTVGRFDDSDHECIAEEFVRMKCGAIGTMGAHAASNTGTNEPIGIELFRLFTNPDTILTMGECYYIAKHIGSGISTYLMLGDPATNLRKVKQSFNLQAIQDSVRPLERLKVISDKKPYYLTAYIKDTTSIKWIDPTTINKISSHIRRTVRTGDSLKDTVIFDYRIEGKEIYQGYWGLDTALFTVPYISTSHLPVIKLSGYKDRSSAVFDSIKVRGTALPVTDQDGPKVSFYDGARQLKNGDWVDKTFMLTGLVSDESGINLLNSKEDARGFFIYVGKDNIVNRIDLRNSFIYNQNSYSEGEFKTEITFDNPQESITVYVSDNCFNQTIEKILLNSNIYERISIENILIYPNPVKNHNGIWITFVLSQSAKATIKIYTIAGRLVKVFPDIPCQAGYNQKFWDGRDEYGDDLSNGVYLVHILVEGNSGIDKKIEKFIIAR
uniref:T9SS type A sorting domain-containing protein n=1 Tax=candidate division WOR-3 bacterium TaxID=2052148 RepID=A0A7C6AEV7_UNCW3